MYIFGSRVCGAGHLAFCGCCLFIAILLCLSSTFIFHFILPYFLQFLYILTNPENIKYIKEYVFEYFNTIIVQIEKKSTLIL